MYVCINCDVVKMRCVKNGVAVRRADNEVWQGDIYECPSCHVRIIETAPKSVYDGEQAFNTDYRLRGI